MSAASNAACVNLDMEPRIAAQRRSRTVRSTDREGSDPYRGCDGTLASTRAGVAPRTRNCARMVDRCTSN
jgi:hypothetical protein